MRKTMALLGAWMGLAAWLSAGDPVVNSVTISQRAGTKLVDITYTVTDPDGDPMTITVLGRNWRNGVDINMATLSGDGANGAVVTSGTHHLVWDAGADWNGNVDSFRVILRATTDSAIPPPADEFVLIAAGTNSGTDPDRGAYSLTVASAFYVGKYEVSKALWNGVQVWAVSHGYTDLPVGQGKADNHPVHTVSWYDCAKWCNARSEMEGLVPRYYTNWARTAVYRTGSLDLNIDWIDWGPDGYRLPTETEWQYAARGGLSGKRFPWGDTIGHIQANYISVLDYPYDVSRTHGHHPDYDGGDYPYTSPVGSLEAGRNGYGLYDLAGNVWEWTWTPETGSLRERVLRGGGWDCVAEYCRVAVRGHTWPSDAANDHGFRLVRTAP